MRDLPGLYWDQGKNRYFPLSSKPKSSPQPTYDSGPLPGDASSATAGQSTSEPNSVRSLKRRRGVLWNATETMRGSVNASQSCRCRHEIMCSHIASTSRVTKVPIPDPTYSSISAFKTSTTDGRARMFYGDINGWLYSFDDNHGRYGYQPEEEIEYGTTRCWVPEINLTSKISSICISDSTFVATSFGPASKVMVQNLSSADIFILTPESSFLHDIWTSRLRGRSLAIGASKKAILLKDIDIGRSLTVLDTQSDVFAVEQQENLVYTGARNGSIARFDMRLPDLRGQKLLDDHFTISHNSVTHLNIVRSWQLLIGNMNGCLGLYDLRFARGSDPLLTFAGHNNSYTTDLAIAIDPSEDFIFAAGQDRRIRAWSLQSGQPIQPPSSCSPSTTNPFRMEFNKPVAAMQVTNQLTNQQEEMCLWAASDMELFKFHLGQLRN